MEFSVVEPKGCGIGSDAIAIVSAPDGMHGLNASGRSPAGWSPDRFKGMDAMPQKGWDSVTVPGAVSAWVALWRKFGTLPFTQLAQPAINYARYGFPVSPIIAKLWALGGDKLGDQPGFAECFLPNGRAPLAGELFRSAGHADTLEAIADTEGEAFYRGELARRMAADARAHGAVLAEDDLAAHQ